MTVVNYKTLVNGDLVITAIIPSSLLSYSVHSHAYNSLLDSIVIGSCTKNGNIATVKFNFVVKGSYRYDIELIESNQVYTIQRGEIFVI